MARGFVLSAGCGKVGRVGAGVGVRAHMAAGGPVRLALSLGGASGHVMLGGPRHAMPCVAIGVLLKYPVLKPKKKKRRREG